MYCLSVIRLMSFVPFCLLFARDATSTECTMHILQCSTVDVRRIFCIPSLTLFSFHVLVLVCVCVCLCMQICIVCLCECDCFCCLFGKLFNMTLAFACIHLQWVGLCWVMVRKSCIQWIYPSRSRLHIPLQPVERRKFALGGAKLMIWW